MKFALLLIAAILSSWAFAPENGEIVRKKTIVVSLKNQTLSALEGKKLVYKFHCCTGARTHKTPVGTFKIRQRLRYNYALAKYGSAPTPYTLRLDIIQNGVRKHIGIHAFKSVPRRPASHGCIRLKETDAAKLFTWANVGLNVTIK